MKKIRIPREAAYFLFLLIMSFSVAMVAAADFGLSMIVAPAYILSQYFPVLTFGQCEYIVQGLLLVLLCLLLGHVRPIYLTSFVACLLYGAALDFWRLIIPVFNPAVTAPGSMAMGLRLFFFATGTCLTSLGVALCFKTYLYPQVYDFFVKAVSSRFHIDRAKFKLFYDGASLALSLALSLILFHGLVGIGIGTVVTTFVNGPLIGLFERLLDRHVDFYTALPGLEKHFHWE